MAVLLCSDARGRRRLRRFLSTTAAGGGAIPWRVQVEQLDDRWNVFVRVHGAAEDGLICFAELSVFCRQVDFAVRAPSAQPMGTRSCGVVRKMVRMASLLLEFQT